MGTLTSAFLLGLVSACSLPLGALTARFYRPGDRTIAFLMSFGGGALLAALTIDLAGPAVERGHFFPLALGCLLGGCLFVLLNEIVNKHGGFLRKASTTLFYLRGQQRRLHKRFIRHMLRLNILRCLGEDELKNLAEAAETQEIEAGTTLFQRWDPARYLYVVEEGIVELSEAGNHAGVRAMSKNSAFGHMALLTGLPHATWAVAREDSTVLMVPRKAIEQALQASPELTKALVEFLDSDELHNYLVDDQNLEAGQAHEAAEQAKEAVQAGRLPLPVGFYGTDRFSEIANDVRRVSFFADLPSEEVHEIAARVFRKRYSKGYTFFYKDEPADRMFIVDSGEVALLDAEGTERSALRVKGHDAFGTLSFVTGTRHAMTAVATSDTEVWILARTDFDRLLERCPRLAVAIQRYIQREDVEDYLKNKHHLQSDLVANWMQRAVRSMDLGRLIPHASKLETSLAPQQGAPLAIWLGILLDGIPESLVIGSSMHYHGISSSLIVGLFLANYPEALSSSVGMHQQGIDFPRVLLMWTSLMIITGVGAALGNLLFQGTPAMLFAFVQGVAAGAMLTMIAETMLPEAYLKGGNLVGISTLLGFLAAIYTKTLG